MDVKTILVNLQRCTMLDLLAMLARWGKRPPDEKFWLTVRTEGSGEGITGLRGWAFKPAHELIPIWSKSCVRCGGRLAEGELPYCVNACPNGALSVGDAAAGECEALRQRGFRIFKLPAWENAADNVVYASKG